MEPGFLGLAAGRLKGHRGVSSPEPCMVPHCPVCLGAGHRTVGSQWGPQALAQRPNSGPEQDWVLPADGSSIQRDTGDTGDSATCPCSHALTKTAVPLAFGAQPPPVPRPSPRLPFALLPFCCPGHSPCPGAGSLLLACGSLKACSWLAHGPLVARCPWLHTRGHCRGDSSTHIRAASWAGHQSSLQPHF